MPNYDAVVCVGPRHDELARTAIGALQKHSKARQILVLTSRERFDTFAPLKQQNMPLVLLDEDKLIPRVTLIGMMSYLERRGAKSQRAGWYFQQFLKMAASFHPEIAEHYLIWDADTILLKPLEFFDADGTVLIKPSQEHHAPYFKLTQKLLGAGRLAPFSFISEHLMVKQEFMRRLVEKISSGGSGEESWVWTVMDAIDDADLSQSGFSEYETYGTFLAQNYPASYRARPVESLREGASQFGVNPNRYDLHLLSKKYSYVSFERWNRGIPRVVWPNKLRAIAGYYADGLLGGFFHGPKEAANLSAKSS